MPPSRRSRAFSITSVDRVHRASREPVRAIGLTIWNRSSPWQSSVGSAVLALLYSGGWQRLPVGLTADPS